MLVFRCVCQLLDFKMVMQIHFKKQNKMVDMYQELIKTHHIISNISFEIRTH